MDESRQGRDDRRGREDVQHSNQKKSWRQTVTKLAAEKVKGQTMGLLCRLFGKSWQAYYQYRDTLSKQRLKEEMVIQFVKDIRQLDPGIGGEKLHYMYRERFGADYEYMVGRDKMEAIISKNHLNVRLPRRRPRTTDSTHGLPTYPNLVKDLIPIRKNQLWVTDITYIPIWNPDGSYDFCYLSMITDYYTKEIIACYVGETMEAWCSVECLMQALEALPEDEAVDLIHHSDRGVQYVSAAYTSLLVEARIKISMTESGDPKDNAVAERQNNTVKNELLKDIKFHSIGEVRRAMAKAVEFYNNERPHMSLNNNATKLQNCKSKNQFGIWGAWFEGIRERDIIIIVILNILYILYYNIIYIIYSKCGISVKLKNRFAILQFCNLGNAMCLSIRKRLTLPPADG